jgi:pyruvate kinase
MNLLWGVHPVFHGQTGTVEGMVGAAEEQLQKQGAVQKADVIGVVGGTRMSTGSTNFMRLQIVGSGEQTTAT